MADVLKNNTRHEKWLIIDDYFAFNGLISIRVFVLRSYVLNFFE